MDLRIERIYLKNFKGITEKEITLNGKSTRISGANGAGKSTLADSFYWLFCDCNTALTKNPPITPIGAEECVSRVEMDMTLDGKPLSVAKSQKYKTKEVDGKVTSAVTNTYEINSVEKPYKAFVADLEERGIDTDNFLIFSHPSAFTADTSKQGREKMRALLFKMCEGYSDADIINELPDMVELKALLNSYKLDEIEQIHKGILKKINEVYGKSNELVNARIDELISQKSKQDIKVLEAQKSQYEAEIKRIEDSLADLSKAKAELSEKKYGLINKRDEYIQKANEKIYKHKTDLEDAIRSISSEVNDKEYKYRQIQREIECAEGIIANKTADIERQRELYKDAQSLVLDESELICPVCKREYDASKIETIKADFEADKAKRLATISAAGNDLKEAINEQKTLLETLKSNVIKAEQDLTEAKAKRDELQNELNQMPAKVDLSGDETYTKLCAEIEKIKAESATGDNDKINELNSQKNVNTQMLNQIIAEIGGLEKNKALDKRIEELRDERKEAEIKRAEAENVLDQVERYKMKRNEKLSEIINSNFEGVEFVFWEYLRNGTINETLKVLISGKEITSQANQASQVKAKLAIIKGLSKYFEKIYPVFVDDASLLTQESVSEIKMDNQLIYLCAKDGYKELTLEEI